MLPCIISLCMSPYTSLGAESPVTYVYVQCFPLLAVHAVFHLTKFCSARLLKDVDIWYTSGLFLFGLTLTWEKLHISIITHRTLFKNIFQFTNSVNSLCVSTGTIWDTVRHMKCLHRAYRQEKRSIRDLHPSEISGSRVGYLSVSNDHGYLHLGNQIPPWMRELQKFNIQTAFLCICSIYINETVAN